MNFNNSISIDEAKFSKSSKKLHNLLNNLGLDIKLSQTQEIFSQSLGFRNLHHLQKTFTSLPFTDIKNNQYTSTTFDIFASLDFEQSIGIILFLMDDNGTDMWRGRAIVLMSSILKLLTYLQEQKELVITSKVINEYLVLDAIIKIYKTRKDLPDDIRNHLRHYLLSLPGFQESAPKQNDVVHEQHGYLKMQFSMALNKLEKIEKNNFVIADKSWFTIKIIDKIVGRQKISANEVTNITKKENVFLLNEKLQDLDFIEDSWLAIPEYQTWVESFYKKSLLNNIRVSDLLVYITTIITPSKRSQMSLVLSSIIDNYSIASNISKTIFSAIDN